MGRDKQMQPFWSRLNVEGKGKGRVPLHVALEDSLGGHYWRALEASSDQQQ